MKFRLSWRAQMVLIVETALILLMVVLLWYINFYLFQMLLRYNEENQLKTLQRVENEVVNCCSSIENLSVTILNDQNVQKFCRDYYEMDKRGVLVRQEAVQSLNQYLQGYPALHSILIQTAGGTSILAERSYTYNSCDAPLTLTGELKQWSLSPAPVRGTHKAESEYLLSFSNIYHTLTQKVQIVLNVDERAVSQLYSAHIEPSGVEVYLYDQNGLILSSSVPEKIGSSFKIAVEQSQELNQKDFQTVSLELSKLNWTIAERISVEHFKRDINQVRNILIWILVCSVTFLNLFIYFSMKRMLQPLKVLTGAMRRIQEGESLVQIKEVYHNEFDDIIRTFNSMSRSIPELMEKNKLQEEQKQRYALSALRAQINPHFLFNTINTIKWMAISQQADHIKSALDMLMVLLRPLFKENAGEGTLQEELEYVSNYVSLVNLRFGGNVRMIVDIPNRLLAQKIPSLILQPIIENCVEHGFHGNYSHAEVLIGCEELEDGLILTIEDNGAGISTEKLAEIIARMDTKEAMLQNGDKIGLANVNLRIQLKYGKSYGITLAAGKSGGTLAKIKLPHI